MPLSVEAIESKGFSWIFDREAGSTSHHAMLSAVHDLEKLEGVPMWCGFLTLISIAAGKYRRSASVAPERVL